MSKRFEKLAKAADVPVIKFHEGGRHTGVSLMHDAEVREDISMREAGHASRDVHARYNHPMIQAHQAAAEQVAELVRKAGGDRYECSHGVPTAVLAGLAQPAENRQTAGQLWWA